mgnify:FL=1
MKKIANILYKSSRPLQISLNAFLMWRQRHVKEKTFVVIVALVVGLFSGLAALLLKALIHFISSFVNSHINIAGANYTYLIYPVIGIFLTMLFVKYIVKDNIGHGVTRVYMRYHRTKAA